MAGVVATGPGLAETVLRRVRESRTRRPGTSGEAERGQRPMPSPIPVLCVPPGVSPHFRWHPPREGGATGRSEDGRPLTVLTVASVVPGKGLLDVLEALARHRVRSWRWCIAGDPGVDPPFTRRLLERANALGLRERIELPGPLSWPALAQLHARADLLVAASREEAWGMGVAEALASGLPVVATRVGAAPLLIRDGEEGLLVPPGNPGALAGALGRLLGEPELRRRLRLANRDRPRRTWRTVARELEAACRRILTPGQ